MTTDQADTLVSYIEKLGEMSHHPSVMSALKKDGYTEEEIDDAFKALGEIAGRDCGLL